MSYEEMANNAKKQIMSKAFSSKKADEKELLLETYVNNFTMLKEIEEQNRERELKERESERKHKRYIIKSIIVAIAIVLVFSALIAFLVFPSEVGVKVIDIGTIAISGLITAFFGVKSKS